MAEDWSVATRGGNGMMSGEIGGYAQYLPQLKVVSLESSMESSGYAMDFC